MKENVKKVLSATTAVTLTASPVAQALMPLTSIVAYATDKPDSWETDDAATRASAIEGLFEGCDLTLNQGSYDSTTWDAMGDAISNITTFINDTLNDSDVTGNWNDNDANEAWETAEGYVDAYNAAKAALRLAAPNAAALGLGANITGTTAVEFDIADPATDLAAYTAAVKEEAEAAVSAKVAETLGADAVKLGAPTITASVGSISKIEGKKTSETVSVSVQYADGGAFDKYAAVSEINVDVTVPLTQTAVPFTADKLTGFTAASSKNVSPSLTSDQKLQAAKDEAVAKVKAALTDNTKFDDASYMPTVSEANVVATNGVDNRDGTYAITVTVTPTADDNYTDAPCTIAYTTTITANKTTATASTLGIDSVILNENYDLYDLHPEEATAEDRMKALAKFLAQADFDAKLEAGDIPRAVVVGDASSCTETSGTYQVTLPASVHFDGSDAEFDNSSDVSGSIVVTLTKASKTNLQDRTLGLTDSDRTVTGVRYGDKSSQETMQALAKTAAEDAIEAAVEDFITNGTLANGEPKLSTGVTVTAQSCTTVVDNKATVTVRVAPNSNDSNYTGHVDVEVGVSLTKQAIPKIRLEAGTRKTVGGTVVAPLEIQPTVTAVADVYNLTLPTAAAINAVYEADPALGKCPWGATSIKVQFYNKTTGQWTADNTRLDGSVDSSVDFGYTITGISKDDEVLITVGYEQQAPYVEVIGGEASGTFTGGVPTVGGSTGAWTITALPTIEAANATTEGYQGGFKIPAGKTLFAWKVTVKDNKGGYFKEYLLDPLDTPSLSTDDVKCYVTYEALWGYKATYQYFIGDADFGSSDVSATPVWSEKANFEGKELTLASIAPSGDNTKNYAKTDHAFNGWLVVKGDPSPTNPGTLYKAGDKLVFEPDGEYTITAQWLADQPTIEFVGDDWKWVSTTMLSDKTYPDYLNGVGGGQDYVTAKKNDASGDFYEVYVPGDKDITYTGTGSKVVSNWQYQIGENGIIRKLDPDNPIVVDNNNYALKFRISYEEAAGKKITIWPLFQAAKTVTYDWGSQFVRSDVTIDETAGKWVDSASVRSGKDTILPTPAVLVDGWKFKHWVEANPVDPEEKAKPVTERTSVAAGSPITVTADVKYIAVWEQISSDDPVPTVTVAKGEAETISITKLVPKYVSSSSDYKVYSIKLPTAEQAGIKAPANRIFNGWRVAYTDSSDGNTYSAKEVPVSSSAVDLTTIKSSVKGSPVTITPWFVNGYTVTYTAGLASSEATSKEYDYKCTGSSKVATINLANADGNTLDLTEAANSNGNGIYTLFGLGTAPAYRSFIGWAETTTSDLITTSTTINSAKTYVAQWKDEIAVTYNKGTIPGGSVSGSVVSASVSLYSGRDGKFAAYNTDGLNTGVNELKAAQYAFDGWEYTDQNGKKTKFAVGENIASALNALDLTKGTTVALVATWRSAVPTVNAVMNNGENKNEQTWGEPVWQPGSGSYTYTTPAECNIVKTAPANKEFAGWLVKWEVIEDGVVKDGISSQLYTRGYPIEGIPYDAVITITPAWGSAAYIDYEANLTTGTKPASTTVPAVSGGYKFPVPANTDEAAVALGYSTIADNEVTGWEFKLDGQILTADDLKTGKIVVKEGQTLSVKAIYESIKPTVDLDTTTGWEKTTNWSAITVTTDDENPGKYKITLPAGVIMTKPGYKVTKVLYAFTESDGSKTQDIKVYNGSASCEITGIPAKVDVLIRAAESQEVYTVTYAKGPVADVFGEAPSVQQVNKTSPIGSLASTDAFKLKNYKCLGWYESTDPDMTVLTTSYVPTKDVTLYPKWQKDIVTPVVNIDGNGGTYTGDPIIPTRNVSGGWDLTTPAKNAITYPTTGKYSSNGIFNTWQVTYGIKIKTCAAATGVPTIANDDLSSPSDVEGEAKEITLKALWKAGAHVKFNINIPGADIAARYIDEASTTLDFGENGKAIDVGFSDYMGQGMLDAWDDTEDRKLAAWKDLHEFMGWSRTPGGDVLKGTVDLTEGAEFYAVWEEASYEITIKGGTGVTAADKTDKASKISQKYVLPECEFDAPEGKTFAGWYVGGATTPTAAGREVPVNANTTITAAWKDAPVIPRYVVTIEGNNASNKVTTSESTVLTSGVEVEEGTELTLVIADGMKAVITVDGKTTTIKAKDELKFVTIEAETTIAFEADNEDNMTKEEAEALYNEAVKNADSKADNNKIYTAAAIEGLLEAIADAKKVMNNSDSTPKEIAEAAGKITSTLEALDASMATAKALEWTKNTDNTYTLTATGVNALAKDGDALVGKVAPADLILSADEIGYGIADEIVEKIVISILADEGSSGEVSVKSSKGDELGSKFTAGKEDTKTITVPAGGISGKISVVVAAIAPNSTIKVTKAEAVGTVTVTVDPNGASDTMKPESITTTDKYELPVCTLDAPKGKKFKAWSVDGKEYDPKDTITVVKDTIIKAIWEDKTEGTSVVTITGATATSKVTDADGKDVASGEVETGAKLTIVVAKGMKATVTIGEEKAVVYTADTTITVTADTKIVFEEDSVVVEPLAQPATVKSRAEVGKIVVMCSKVTGAKNYKLFYTTDNGKTINKVGDAKDRTWEITNPEVGKTYKFLVLCYNGTNWSKWKTSDFTADCKAVSAKPAQPTTIKSNCKNGVVTVMCSKVADAKTYRLFWTLDNGKNYTKVGDSKDRTWKITDLEAGKTYKFLVLASNGTAWSAYTKGTCDAAVTPTLPQPTTIKPTVSGTKVTVKCSTVKGAKKYRLFYYENGKLAKVGDSTNRTWTFTGKKGATYKFLVLCYDGKGWSTYTKGEGYSEITIK